MKKRNRNIRVAGLLFLLAMVSSIAGGGMIEAASGKDQLMIGVLLEVSNAFSVLGIGILLFSELKQCSQSTAKTYLVFRILETIACFSAALIPLFAVDGGTDLRALFTGTLIPLFFCGGALVFYFLLFKHRLLPRFISIWGWLGVVLIILLNILRPQGEAALLLALPIILNEIFLGIWLIVRGFSRRKLFFSPRDGLLSAGK